jgi:hypothetical protein
MASLCRPVEKVEGDHMDPLKVAARFCAFACSLNDETPNSPKEAARYARENWKEYLPYVGEDLVDFLTAPPPPWLKSLPRNHRAGTRKKMGQKITV